MTKTATPNQPKNSNSSIAAHQISDDIEQQNEVFYSNLKPKLDALRRDPSEEIINKILAYARQK